MIFDEDSDWLAISPTENQMVALKKNPDSRRVYWPIFRTKDSLRAGAPSRIPCSLGYQAMIRKVGGTDHLILTYLQRSADFDRFWLSDIWLARKFQLNLAEALQIQGGALIHFIISFHSFDVTTACRNVGIADVFIACRDPRF